MRQSRTTVGAEREMTSSCDLHAATFKGVTLLGKKSQSSIGSHGQWDGRGLAKYTIRQTSHKLVPSSSIRVSGPTLQLSQYNADRRPQEDPALARDASFASAVRFHQWCVCGDDHHSRSTTLASSDITIFWGCPLRYHSHKNEKAIIFDFLSFVVVHDSYSTSPHRER
ncbi:hypothetical protein PGTUg99_032460 [Puccinia graminis f. sp. tritici]|uniref:Uncharacterized protein n=1 Tax=Puccinia graminis f. sp. tritici TaxID=56615 RepID=A0A5B0RTQ3_PUCGR|nr:hypothetical protein PGTUg99_032460 [Puccinia graminis f. sp. tritici]